MALLVQSAPVPEYEQSASVPEYEQSASVPEYEQSSMMHRKSTLIRRAPRKRTGIPK